jgi:Domain of unknown function (DUF929)
MSRSTQAGRRRAEQARLAEARARARRRRVLVATLSIATPLVLIAVMVIVRVSRPPVSAATPSELVSATVVDALAVPPSILDAVGRGSVTSLPDRLKGEPALVDGGRPLVLYVGAEYCPFCAAQRWGLVVALTRFGTFHGLRTAASGVEDVFPATATVSFHGATYDSQYLTFAGVELATSQRSGGVYEPLDTLTAAQTAVVRKYNAAPYVAASSAGAVPFVDFGNRFLMSGSTFSPSLLSGLDQEQIAAALADPSSQVARAVLGSANAFTTILCGLTNQQPAAVCASPAATAFPEVANAAA